MIQIHFSESGSLWEPVLPFLSPLVGRDPTTGLLKPFVNTEFGWMECHSHQTDWVHNPLPFCPKLSLSLDHLAVSPCHSASKPVVLPCFCGHAVCMCLNPKCTEVEYFLCIRPLDTEWICGYKHVEEVAVTASLARQISSSDLPEKNTLLQNV